VYTPTIQVQVLFGSNVCLFLLVSNTIFFLLGWPISDASCGFEMV